MPSRLHACTSNRPSAESPRPGRLVDGDSNGALAILVTVVLAVFHQRRAGRGQFVRTSMISGNAWCYADDFCSYAGKPPAPARGSSQQ